MVFTSPTFLFAFLPVVLALTWVTPTRGRRFVLLLASFFFYAWGVQTFLLAVIVSTLVDWALARGIEHTLEQGRRRRARALLVLGLVQNLALLGWFKYASFASVQLDRIAQKVGIESLHPLHVLLPIGISFFTFEKISYLVDVWRGHVVARRDPVDVLLFVALFPRSIAGPIVRLAEIQDALRRPQPTAAMATEGAIRFSHGLAKKVLIADQISPIADAAFAAAPGGGLTMAAAWLGAVVYSLQLYFDFSGYSDMAIGIALMLGFRLPENFHHPYSSVSITDFWRRWHMTLSRWFRDYVYIPLGGSRGDGRATTRNLLIVFTLTGLWHGAGWAFPLWGLYHGAWLIIERRRGWRRLDGEVRRAPLHRATTLLIVLIGWVLFRAESLHLAAHYFKAMIAFHGGITPAVHTAATAQALTALVIGALVVFLPRKRSLGRFLTDGIGNGALALRLASLGVVLPVALLMAFSSTFSPFLYFQF